MKEQDLHQQIVDYIKYQYPKVLFRTDFAAGIKMTIGQAVRHKKLQKCDKWPDLFIAQGNVFSNGLFIELKRSREEVFLKSGLFKKNKHIQEQKNMLCELEAKGYTAVFGCGFHDTKDIIDRYLK